MEREEAIQALKDLRDIRLQGVEWKESLDMAIEALSERNIAREIATILENEQDMRVMLQNAERQKGEWICKDRLPLDGVVYIECECSVCGETDKAVRLCHDRQNRGCFEVWLPFSK